MKLVILSRDGIINKSFAGGVIQPDQWLPLPGSLEAIARLQREGYRVVVVTDQPGISLGALRMETLNRIHVRMLEAVRNKGGQIDAVFVCPHAAHDKCRCRAPSPGLYEQLSERLKISLPSVYAACATEDETAAARAAGARPVLVGGAGTVAPGLQPAFAGLGDFVDAMVTGGIRR